MMNRYSFEAVDRTFRDIMGNDKPWAELLQLTENTRVRTPSDPQGATEIEEFANFLLEEDIEEEDFPNFALLPPDQEGVEGLVVHDYYEQNLNTLIDAVYPGVGGANVTDEYFAERVILAPTNENIWRLNEMVADRLSGETLERLSVDIMEGSDNMLFKPELLRSLNFIFISDDDKDFVFPASTQAVSSISSIRRRCAVTGERFEAVVSTVKGCVKPEVVKIIATYVLKRPAEVISDNDSAGSWPVQQSQECLRA
ncbi:hypothetical protein PPTG_24871 [Phytophthora nicotianae INRA-310]|uniref:Uncharacterized protein n=1 Tax=Phytophthora nicotianae (strain INRA-310) TaxID=761204 RepID=W2PCD6_PHYN3|nr:hypothetical protein PPTG_24871 [Phytophthora nicotianae INRA-310]ETM97674.1 hypothetical protein PPTG_24871 [Phytophthora nicotianae INRA-310]